MAPEKSGEDRLQRWERKLLRLFRGGVKAEDELKERANKELKVLHYEPKITAYIKPQGIRWVGYIERLKNARIIKIALGGKPI